MFNKIWGDTKMKSPFEQRPDYVVCTCMEVMHDQIVDAIKHGADTFEQLSELLGVGMGCSSCVDEVNAILAEYKKRGGV